jgi:DNA recombination-dependent growth factor C
MNLVDLQSYAQLLGVPVSVLIIAMALWLTVGKWLRDSVIPRWLASQEQASKAMQDISQIVKSLEHEVRESRQVSIENNERLSAMDVKLDQVLGRAANVRQRKVGD